QELIPLKGWNQNTSFQSILRMERSLFNDFYFGRTAPSKVFEDALKHKKFFDNIIIITDNDLNSGAQPTVLLEKYKKSINPNVKVFYISTSPSSRHISLADPKDPNSYDFCGFGSNTPKLIQYLMNN